MALEVHPEADTLITKFAPRFWGVNRGNAVVPYPQTVEYKLDFLKKTLAVVSVLTAQELEWVQGKRDKTPAGIQKHLDRPIRLPKKAVDAPIEPPKTASDAYKNPQIAFLVHLGLNNDNNASEYVRKGYVAYQLAHEYEIDGSSLVIGFRALDLFMFAAGGSDFTNKVREVTARHYATAAACPAA